MFWGRVRNFSNETSGKLDISLSQAGVNHVYRPLPVPAEIAGGQLVKRRADAENKFRFCRNLVDTARTPQQIYVLLCARLRGRKSSKCIRRPMAAGCSECKQATQKHTTHRAQADLDSTMGMIQRDTNGFWHIACIIMHFSMLPR